MDKPIVPSRIRKIFEGRVFTVNVESIVLPKGKLLEAEIIRHPGSVVLVPVTETSEIVLVRQYRHPIGRWAWELPAGSLKYGENPAAAAGRECQEETGFVAASLEPLGSFFPTPGYCDEEMHFYRATGLRPAGCAACRARASGCRSSAARPGRPDRASGRGRRHRDPPVFGGRDPRDDPDGRADRPEDDRGARAYRADPRSRQ